MEVNVLKINTDETEILMFGCDKLGRVGRKRQMAMWHV